MSVATKYTRSLKEATDFFVLAEMLYISPKKLNYIVQNAERYYKEFDTPKKTGGYRRIVTSKNTELAKIQYRIKKLLEFSLRDEYIPEQSQAYQRKRGIYTNAKKHRNKKYVFILDLEDYFPTFHFGRVLGFFEKNNSLKLNHNLAVVLTKLVTYKGTLPQGTATSPILSNYISRSLDKKLIGFARKNGFLYSRYADDISFSTDNLKSITDLPSRLPTLIDTIDREGFKVNWSKFNLSGPDVRHVVTGLTVNKKVAVKKEYYKETRAMVNSLFRTGAY